MRRSGGVFVQQRQTSDCIRRDVKLKIPRMSTEFSMVLRRGFVFTISEPKAHGL